MTNQRLPNDYEAPKTIGNYLKLVDWHNKFRILSQPILWRLDWDEKKPIRTKDKPETAIDPTRPPKFFWAMVVRSYDNKKIQIWEVTQSSIQRAIEWLVADADFGTPLDYDLKITKSGKDLETRYEVKPLSKAPLTEEIAWAFMDAKVDLNKLYSWQDPFSS